MHRLKRLPGFGLVISIGFGSISFAADEPNPWRVAPPLVKEQSSADREAREEMLKLIETKQTKEYREQRILEVPERASGVPENYDLLLYRSDSGWTDEAVRLEVQVRGGQATLELCDGDGIFRAQQPAAQIDRLVRQIAYAFHSVERPRQPAEYRAISSWATDTPSEPIEVISRDDKSPFHLKTPDWQTLAEGIDLYYEGIRGFAHTRLNRAVHKLAFSECQLIEEEAETRQILRRLQAIPVMKADGSTRRVTELTTVDGLVFGALAVKRGLAPALPELQRLGLKDFHRQLEIAASANPGPAVQNALVAQSKDEKLSGWALDYARDDRHPERLQWLVNVLPQGAFGEEVIWLRLAGAKLNPEQIGQIEKLFAGMENRLAKVHAASALLNLTHQRGYFEFLEKVVRNPTAKDTSGGWESPRRAAAEHLFSYATKSGKFRGEAYGVLKLLLAEPRESTRPDSFEMFELVESLGQLGSLADLSYLKTLAQSESVYLSSYAIEAMANIAPADALAQFHRRLERLNRGQVDEHDYSHEVYSHFDLLVFERDTAAIPLLKQVWRLLNATDSREAPSDGYDPQRVLDYLEAQSTAARVEATIAYFGDRARYADPVRMQRFVKQLIAEGGDPDRCLRLVQDKVRDRGR